MTTKRFLLIGALIISLIAGLVAANFLLAPKQVQLTAGTLLNEPRDLPDFLLTDQDNHFIHKADLEGHWTIMFPGFSYCPDVCPATLGFLKQLTAVLNADGLKLNVLFFSVDPERDTPQRLTEYIRFFSPNFTAATLSEPKLGEFAKSLGVAYTKVPGATLDNYTMDHSAALILIDPKARVTAYFTPPHKLEDMTTDLKALMTAKP